MRCTCRWMPPSKGWIPSATSTEPSFADSAQMMRSQAYGNRLRLGTMLAAGLTLRHYASFARCPTLPALTRRLDAELNLLGTGASR